MNFATTNLYKLRGLYLGDKSEGKCRFGNPEGAMVKLGEAGETKEQDLSDLKAKKVALVNLVESLLVKRRDFADSIAMLRELAERLDLPKDEVEDLEVLIKEFGTYEYKRKKSDTGDCLIIPLDFSSFCRRKMGIKLEEARYGEYHPEWGSDMGYEPYTFLHKVNVYAGKIVIDWTVTQYASHREKPMPYIYEIGAEKKRFGPLYRITSRIKDPNELFIEDPTAEPVSYGI